ncbi:class F sortase [Actinomycetospora chiangmaiensis]|uniref:class F sortase n=1 Tax=Actinomycetospora chiangmaiensis TaxID=402650 RepID=UPI000380D5B3|nr:class F sortase [Actinomycetospora chiangmaiensis]
MTVRSRIVIALLAVVGMVGVVLVVLGLTAGPRSAAPVATAETRAPVTVSATPPPAPVRLPASPPTRIAIPAIGVDSVVNPSGLNPDGTLQVPAPGPRYDQAAWYTGSASPGQDGPSVILGHIDSAKNGPSVFYRLAQLRPLDEFTVTRADGVVLVFRVNSVQQYPKDAFPSQEVYGPTPRPEMRLITCGGAFDDSTRSYRDNTVVYASRIA